MSGLILVSYLSVRERGLALRTPVDDPLATIDKAFLIILYEDLLDCL